MHNERGQEIHENDIIEFSKKIFFGAIELFWTQLFYILYNARNKEVLQNYANGFSGNILLWGRCCINVFSEKIPLQDNWTIFRPKITRPRNSRSAITIFFNFAQWNGPDLGQNYANGFFCKTFFETNDIFQNWLN